MNERMKRREEGEVEAEMRHVWLRGEGGRIYLYRERVVDWRQTNKPNQFASNTAFCFCSFEAN